MTAGPRRRGAPVPGRDRNPARARAVCSAGVGLIRPARGVRVAVEPAFRLARCASLRRGVSRRTAIRRARIRRNLRYPIRSAAFQGLTGESTGGAQKLGGFNHGNDNRL